MATTLTNIYSDLDLNFNPNPVTGDLVLSYDSQAVIRSVRNLLLTNFYERPFQPDLGSNLSALLFEPITPLIATAIQNEIINTITNYEPRVTLEYVYVTEDLDNNAYSVFLQFFIGNNTSPNSVNLLLERTR